MAGTNKWSVPHTLSVVLNIVLFGLWLLASATTSVYFHLPSEKITGFCEFFVLRSLVRLLTSLIYSPWGIWICRLSIGCFDCTSSRKGSKSLQGTVTGLRGGWLCMDTGSRVSRVQLSEW